VGRGGLHHVDAGPVDIEELFMNLRASILIAALLAGCAKPPEPEYRQPWTVYKTKADIVLKEKP
jgi:hypothetical protein